MERVYSYLIVRYSPDPVRGEQVNIGLLVQGEDLDIRLTSNMRKAIAIDSRRDASSVLALEDDMRQWLNGEKDFDAVRQLLTKFGPVSVSEVAWFKCRPNEYEAAVDRLMADLVTPPTVAKVRDRLRGRLVTEAKAMFKKNGLLGDDVDDLNKHLVVANYPVAVNDNLFADFALKNGRMHFTEVVDFRVREPKVKKDKFNEVGLKSLILQRCRELDKGSNRYFVYAVDRQNEREISSHLNLMSGYCERIYNFSSRAEKAAYLETMLAAAAHS